MHIVDLSLPINRHMPGIPTIPEYAKNPTRCRVTAALSPDHLEEIKAKGLETADGLATAGIMSRIAPENRSPRGVRHPSASRRAISGRIASLNSRRTGSLWSQT